MDLFGTLTRTPATGTVTLRHHYRTTPEDLWAALTTPERLARWFAPVAGDLHLGGNYHIDFEPGDDAQQVHGVITACDAPHELTVTWKAKTEENSSEVHCTLTPGDSDSGHSGTHLTLTHSGIHHKNDVGMAAGWDVYIRHLKWAVEPTTDSDPQPGDWWEQWSTLEKEYRKHISAD